VYIKYPDLLESTKEVAKVSPFPGSLEVIAHSRESKAVEGVVVNYLPGRGVLVVRADGEEIPVIVRGCWVYKGKVFAHEALPLRPGLSLKALGTMIRVDGRDVAIARDLVIDGYQLHRVRCPHLLVKPGWR